MLFDSERERLLQLTVMERKKRKEGFQVIAGVDEAGRGPLAGPVFAAACIIPPEVFVLGVNDSKKLSAQERHEIFERLTQDERIDYGIGRAEVDEIDAINILQATMRAMLRAIQALKQAPHLLLVDGLYLAHPQIPCEKMIKGDANSQSIGAASILAKVSRDRLMLQYHEQWPDYGFDQHKGYGTEHHREMLSRLGPCPIHRRSFEPLKSTLQLSLFA